MKRIAVISAAVMLLFFSNCSSAPKRPTAVYELRNLAASQLDLANREADRGNFTGALDMLYEARRVSISIDDSDLRIRTSLSLGDVSFSLGRQEEASAAWNTALDEAVALGSRELAAISRIHIARGRLLADPGDKSTAQSVNDEVAKESGALKDKFFNAFSDLVTGLAEKELGRYNEAETALRRSLAVHDRERYLEQAAYDWYLIGSVRSNAGKYADAVSALNSAIEFDRRIENSWGLAADWRALGDVQKKAGKTEESAAAYRRSAQIYRSLGLAAEALDAERRITL
jgi:tetratricopeptide (TPR) repeat protein